MYCFVMQERITIRGASNVTTFNQSADSWLDLTPFQDIVAWLDVSELTQAGGASALQIALQTAPTKDDALFQAVAPASALGVGLTIAVMLKDALSPAVPLSRWLRWQLIVSGGTPNTTWDATFRIYIAANSPGHRRTALGAAVQPPGVIPSRTRQNFQQTLPAPSTLVSVVPNSMGQPSTPLHLQERPVGLVRAPQSGTFSRRG